MTVKEVKQLNKAYKNKLNSIQKNFFEDRSAGLALFGEYLRYLRDSIIMSEYNNALENSKVKMATIIAAVTEFDAYLQTQNDKQKTFHWNIFCELLNQNMEDWLKIDDSV